MQLNCDMAEIDLALDAQLMPFIDQANIACGLHASNSWMISQVVQMAQEHGVSIGVHPSYDDHEGFGRREMDVPLAELETLIHYQVGALWGVCESHGAAFDYIKPHGALYNTMMINQSVMETLLSGAAFWQEKLKRRLPMMVMACTPGHFVHHLAAKADIDLIFEAFCDRAYRADGSLAPRSMDGAVLKDMKTIERHLKQLIEKGEVTSIDGTVIPIKADSLCIHGDSPFALQTVEIAKGLIQRYAD